jgi:hypothetical protein
MPWDFANLNIREKAVLIAMIDIGVEEEKKHTSKGPKK